MSALWKYFMGLLGPPPAKAAMAPGDGSGQKAVSGGQPLGTAVDHCLYGEDPRSPCPRCGLFLVPYVAGLAFLGFCPYARSRN
ncbi:MAG TPA: hypothetical protein DCX12_01110 [Chloroflexi bacterium]|jgi:hypothetical protein|nr:hypothetical protein [Chloroflexota bacterium]